MVKIVNWKTTVGGVITALPDILTTAGDVLAPEVASIVRAIGILIMAATAKDNDVTGGVKKNRGVS